MIVNVVEDTGFHQTSATEAASHARETATAPSWQPYVPPTSVCFLFFACSSWQPAIFPLLHIMLFLAGLFSDSSPVFVCVKWFSRWRLLWGLWTGSCLVCVFFPKPVPTPRTAAQGLLKCSMADIQHCLATLSSRKWLPYCFIYCQKQLALTLMANYFVQVISLKIWAQTRLAHWKKNCPFFGHRVCGIISCEWTRHESECFSFYTSL